MAKKALLIIDMQRGDFPPVKARYQSELIIDRINNIASDFRAKGNSVIYIQHDGSAENVFMPDTYEWQILPELMPQSMDQVVSKTANNAFYRSELDAVLKEMDISDLFISGSATDFCVNATVQGALALDYQITVIADAHTTADRPSLSAQQVIDHYNWVWENMTPTGGSLKVAAYNMEE